MSKRPHSPEPEVSEKEAKMENEEGGGSMSAAKAQRGAPIFPIDRPLKLLNKNTLVFTKHFYFKIYANDWIYTPIENGADVVGFMTVIPYQALCMYLSPNEYLDIIRQSNFASIKEAKLELEFKAVRTPFDANSTDAAEANGNLQFEIQRWDGIEQMMPFKVADVDITGAQTLYTSNQELINRLYGGKALCEDSPNWPACMRERGLSWRPIWQFRHTAWPTGNGSLYRNMNRVISALPIGEYVTEKLNTNQAKMGEGYCFNKVYKPKNGILTMASSSYNHQNNMTGHTRINQPIRMQDNPLGSIDSHNDQQYVALYPTITEVSMVNGVDTPKQRGIWFDPGVMANGADPGTYVGGGNSNALICNAIDDSAGAGTSYKMQSPCVNPPFGAVSGPKPNQNFGWFFDTDALDDDGNPKFTTNNFVTDVNLERVDVETVEEKDNFGYGYNNDMGYYSVATLENYAMHTSRNPPPIHHMPSMLIGAIPKTTKQENTIVQGTLEFECRTQIIVEVQNVHPTYMNNSYLPFNDVGITSGWADPDNFGNDELWGGRYQHNETDVLLTDRMKHWNKSYGLAGKPLFEDMPENTPLLKK